MTARFTTDPPLASADTWAGKPTRFIKTRYVYAGKGQPEPFVESDAARRDDDGVTPLAEHVVLDCLRALKIISPSPYALELMDMISRVYLITSEHMVRMRRIEALLEISAEEPAP